jgi:asparagine synthase (glutamine-hydrolysing)
MSAITGIFMRNGKNVDPELMKKMNKKLSHRGPDGSDIWCEGPIGLGHQMLWTTPESLHEQLPYEENGLVITADARIDNRDELSKELDIKDEENVSDSYFILKSYEKWGEECPDKLLGDFAFAIWDKAQEKLFCARDHMGVKPFYYYLDDDMFVFGTEIRSILSISEIPSKLNRTKIAYYLGLLLEDKELTFYKNILRLPPANTIIIDIKNYIKSNYWELNINKEIKLNSDEEYKNEFLKIFEESVRCRLRSKFNLGSMLSGGLDSSSIVCTSRKILSEKNKKQLRTYSATFENTIECDEKYYINKVLKDGGLKPYFVKADKLSPLSQKDDVFWHLEEPFWTVNFYFHWHIHKMAQKSGTRVILEGLDGDTTVSHGQRFEIDYFKSMQWIKGLHELYKRSKRIKRSKLKMLLKSFIFPFTPKFIIELVRISPINTELFIENFDLLNKNLAKETNIKEKFKLLEENKDRLARSSKLYHYSRLNSGQMQYVLEIVDKSAGASCLEARFPFFDKRLIEFCLALPLEQKLNNGWDRIIMRRAMENILPKENQWRPDKTNLGPNFRKNFLLYEKNLIEKILYHPSHLIKNYVNINAVRKHYIKYASNKGGSAFKIFGVITLSIWLNNFIDDNK